MLSNVTLHFYKPAWPGQEWIKRAHRSDREYDLVVPLEDITIRLDAYEQDALTVEEADGIIIVSHIKNGSEREVVYSTPLIQP